MKSENKTTRWIIFIAYIVILVYVVFFAEMLGRNETVQEYKYNLIPFREIKRFIIYYKQLGAGTVFLNIAGNIAAFLPLGYYIPVLSKKNCGILKVFTDSVLLSMIIELTQLLTRVGSCDVDDIILNTLGGVTGYVLYCFVMHVKNK